ncbi:MAG: hypothetical protein M0Z64_11070 [Nitrospiraceae bacterium]|nr:hypothetical protein [Nitrospiraceae bacterium]
MSNLIEPTAEKKAFEGTLSVIRTYLNRLVGIFFYPRKFFSENKFSEYEWTKDAIHFFIISYVIFVTIFSLTLISILMRIFPRSELFEISKNFFSPLSLIITSALQLIFVNTLVLYALLNFPGFIKRKIKKYVKKYKRIDGEHKHVSAYKIINILSYGIGTAAIALSLLFKKVLPEIMNHYLYIKEGVPIFTRCSSIATFIILAYITFLFVITHREALKLLIAQ